MSLQIVTTDCYNKSEQIGCIYDTFIYFAQMESFGFVATFLAYRLEKCDNKVSTSCCHIFVTYTGEKNVMTSQNIEVADIKGSHPSSFSNN